MPTCHQPLTECQARYREPRTVTLGQGPARTRYLPPPLSEPGVLGSDWEVGSSLSTGLAGPGVPSCARLTQLGWGLIPFVR